MWYFFCNSFFRTRTFLYWTYCQCLSDLIVVAMNPLRAVSRMDAQLATFIFNFPPHLFPLLKFNRTGYRGPRFQCLPGYKYWWDRNSGLLQPRRSWVVKSPHQNHHASPWCCRRSGGPWGTRASRNPINTSNANAMCFPCAEWNAGCQGTWI